MRIARCLTKTLFGPIGMLFALNVPVAAAAPCAEVSGRYRIDGFGPDLGDALEALQSSNAGFEESGLELDGATDGTLGIGVKSGRSGAWPLRSRTVLRSGLDFECRAGQLNLVRSIAGSRRGPDDGEWYEGSSTITLSRQSDRSLAISVTFTGRQRISLYSYDSANVSIPKPGTRTVMTETIRWPVWFDADTKPLPIPTPPEPAGVLDVRELLSSKVLGNVNLGAVQPSGEGALATFTAPRSDDVIAFEDSLRHESIGYEVRVAPIWTNNAWYMSFVIRPGSAGKSAPWKPSVFRIAHELERLAPVLVGVDSVEVDGDAYIATLSILPGGSLDGMVALLKAQSTLLADIELIEESARRDAPKLRVARLRLRVR